MPTKATYAPSMVKARTADLRYTCVLPVIKVPVKKTVKFPANVAGFVSLHIRVTANGNKYFGRCCS